MFKDRRIDKLQSVLVSMVILLAFFNPVLIASAAGSETISIGSAMVDPGDTVVLPITLADVTDVTGVDVTIVYDANIVIIQNIAANSSVLTGSSLLSKDFDNTAGTAQIILVNYDYITATSAVPIIDITFEVVGSSGSSTLELQDAELSDSDFNPVEPAMIKNGEITIPDTTPPVISNITNTDPTNDSVTISWDTDEESDSVVKYGTTPDNYLNEQSDTTLVSSHSISLTGLSANTTYYYVVNSTDTSDNAGESSEFSFITEAISDTTILIGDATAAPNGYTFTSIMVNNVSDLGSGSISVTYNSSVVHVTNVTSGDGNALVVQDWNVDNSTGSVRIFAQDGTTSHNGDVVLAIVNFHAVGEYPDSTSLAISSSELIDYTSYDIIGHSVTNGTFSIIDNEPPVITDAIATLDIILNDNGRPRAPGTNVTVLNATVLDSESGVVNVTINLSSIGGSDNQVMERVADTDIWTVATTATDGINQIHELVVTATDGADNTNTSVIELTVLLRGDVVRDGVLNSADALYIAKYLVDKEAMPLLLVSDMSPDIGDGRVNSADALYLAKYLVGKEAAP